jgi:hypothetical protein
MKALILLKQNFKLSSNGVNYKFLSLLPYKRNITTLQPNMRRKEQQIRLCTVLPLEVKALKIYIVFIKPDGPQI